VGGFLLFEQLFKDRQNPAPEKNRPMNFMNGDEGCNEWGGGPQCMYLDSRNQITTRFMLMSIWFLELLQCLKS
jgi:hypothetical protein